MSLFQDSNVAVLFVTVLALFMEQMITPNCSTFFKCFSVSVLHDTWYKT